MLEIISDWVAGMLPKDFHPFDMLPSLGIIIAVVFIMAVLIRVISDKASKYNHALASAMALLFAYLFLMMIHGSDPPEYIKEAIRVLPLIDYENGVVTIFKFSGDHVLLAFEELLYAFILSFILIGLDDMIPDSKNALAWIVLQSTIVAMSVFLYWIVIRAINSLIPGVLDSYAPLVLGCILLFMIALGLLKLIMGLLVVAVNPLLGAVSAFFGSSPVGKALGKAALCSMLLCGVAYFVGNAGLTSFALVDMTFLVCFLPMLVLLLLWFVVGYVL